MSTRGTRARAAARTATLAGVVAGAALLPLFGDPNGSAVSHAEWARLLLRGLDLLDPTVRVGDQASIAFAALSGRGSISLRADQYIDGRGIETVGGDRPGVRATGNAGEVSYALAVARPGEYRLRLRMSGDPTVPTEAEISAEGDAPKQTFFVVPAGAPGWVDAGSARLTMGAYTASVLLPPGAELQQIEVAPPCVNAIEPRGGWRAAAVTTTDDAALTTLRAVDLERELPPADLPIDLLGSDFQRDPTTPALIEVSAGLDTALRSGPAGTKAVVLVNLAEAGLYSLSYFGTRGNGLALGVDRCRRSVLCPEADTASRWHPVLSAEFAAGEHAIDVLMGPGALIERLRLERKKDGPADYRATLKRLGLDLGESAPLGRDMAGEAWRWVAGKKAPREEQCGEVVIPEVPVQSAGPTEAFAAPVPPGPVPIPPPPIGPPVIVPPDELSPTEPLS
jgi:hypothetical protein